MYQSRKKEDKSFGDIFLKAISKAIATVIVAALAYACEFGLNPGRNTSVIVDYGQVVVVEGINCQGDTVPWRFTAINASGSGDHARVKLLTWVQTPVSAMKMTEVEVKKGGELALESCSGKKVNVALVWSIDWDKKSVHLRAHPGFKIYPDPEGAIPEKGGEQ